MLIINSYLFICLEIKRREAMSSQMFFETEDNTSNSDLLDMLGNGSSNSYGQQLQMQQSNQTQTFAAILIEEENAKMATQWEREANQITSSVVELNNIFKDLAHMVVQQVSLYSIILIHIVLVNIIKYQFMIFLIFCRVVF